MLRTLLAALAAVVFSGICNDKRVDCSNWARDGECTGDNSRYMMEICPLSCGVCTHVCNDTDTSCGAWATAGECEANPESMLRICPTSCGLCTPECKDTNADCPGWGGSGECNENPEFMIRTCPVTCEACKSTCKDLANDCPGWTADGECYKNVSWVVVATLDSAIVTRRRSRFALSSPVFAVAFCSPCARIACGWTARLHVQGVPQLVWGLRGRQVRGQQRHSVRHLG